MSAKQSSSPDAKKLVRSFRAPFKGGIHLEKYPTRDKCGFDDKEQAYELLHAEHEKLKALQNVLYAESKHAVLVVLQAMDTGGKDGAIRRVLGPLNPQGVRVHSFKAPNGKELAHDFLWRIHSCTPKKGMIHVFNRSHYEDVLIARVHDLAPKKTIEQRYAHINNFERLLADNGTVILKFYLHISKEEQKERLQERLDNADKHWKFSSADLKERDYWKDYQKAYELALSRCSTPWAPWYVIPADRKWVRNIIMARILRYTLENLKMKYPPAEKGLERIEIQD